MSYGEVQPRDKEGLNPGNVGAEGPVARGKKGARRAPAGRCGAVSTPGLRAVVVQDRKALVKHNSKGAKHLRTTRATEQCHSDLRPLLFVLGVTCHRAPWKTELTPNAPNARVRKLN